MTDQEEAQRFLNQLKAQASPYPGRFDAADAKNLVDGVVQETAIPELRRDPRLRPTLEQTVTDAMQDIDATVSRFLTRKLANIEHSATDRFKSFDLESRRPVVGHMRTGQLNAVSMRVPGRSNAYVVLFEDQMTSFTAELAEAIAWAIPGAPGDSDGQYRFNLTAEDVAERIAADPEVSRGFADLVVSYAVSGGIRPTSSRPLSPGTFQLTMMLVNSLQYFVLGHEYAHILLGHLDTTVNRAGVLPILEAETLAYSWDQEFDADLFGTVLSINAYTKYEDPDFSSGFSGIGLFFDVLEVMDRAVALLQTGDENARQLGSHPPSDLRKQRLRDFLTEAIAADPETVELVRAALNMGEHLSEIIHLLWEHTRPILLDLRKRGVPAAPTWRTILKQTDG